MRRNQMIAVSTAVLLGVSVLSAGMGSADETFRTLDEIKESGTINIGVFSEPVRLCG